MTDVSDLLAHRARAAARGLLAAYQRQRDAMRIAGVPSSELAQGDDGTTVVADVAACMTVAGAAGSGLTAPVLARMRASEEAAFAVVTRAAQAYWASAALRRDLGRAAEASFERLRGALPGEPAGT